MPVNWEEIIDDDVLAHYKRTRTMQKDFAALADRLEFLGESRDRQNDASAALVCRLNALDKLMANYADTAAQERDALTARIAVLERAHNQAARAGRLDALLENQRQFTARLGALEQRQAELEGTREAVEAVSLAMYAAGRERNDLARRLAELENPPLLGPPLTGEWARGGGQQPDDAYNIDATERREET